MPVLARPRAVVGVVLGAVFAVGCAGLLGLDEGSPLDAPSEAGGADVYVAPDTGSDAPTAADAADGGTPCGTDQKSCNGCQSTADPNFGCTTAGCASCATLLGNPPQVTGYACSGPGCAVTSCAIDFANCDRDAANGCESNLKSDPKHCSDCAKVCDAGQFCVNGGCEADCGAPYQVCDAACVQTQGDPFNCNGCGIKCPGPPNGNGNATCVAATCGFTCNPSYGKCPDGCWFIQNDPTHCGPACVNCSGAPPPSNAHSTGCTSGTCTFACNLGYVDVGGICVVQDAGSDAGDGATCSVSGSLCAPVGPNGMCCSNMCVTPDAGPEGGTTAGGRCL
jgi:hypothetical protein